MPLVYKKSIRTNVEQKRTQVFELEAKLRLLKFYIEHNKNSSKYSLTKILPTDKKSWQQLQPPSNSEPKFKLPIAIVELAKEPRKVGGAKMPKTELLVKRVRRDIDLFNFKEEDHKV
jgi:hypothetical protein